MDFPRRDLQGGGCREVNLARGWFRGLFTRDANQRFKSGTTMVFRGFINGFWGTIVVSSGELMVNNG